MVWVLVLFALVGAGVWITHKKGKVLLNTILLCVGVILIGYSSYASVVIRSSVNPPMNSNRPDNPYGLLGLLNRVQYGSQPLLYGPTYSSPITSYKYSNVWYLGEDGKYHSRKTVSDYVYAPGSEMLFPRLWDANPGATEAYKSWLGTEGRRTSIGGRMVTMPTMGDNLRFFFGYQFNYMYWRYFMWNFVGRQDDIQGRGDILHGNWLSGIDAIDRLYLGPQDGLPDEVEHHPARNKFFFLPFLLGILGLISQVGRDKRGFSIVMWLFVMMGVALVVYFNISGAVRERDYIYAGSFYAFSIWIGLGVLWIQEIVAKAFKRECWASAAIATVVCLSVPTLMAAQGWDDHDRSGRYIGHDLGYNMLVSTLPNSIIMNFGDNDTFPLWYNQEVENVRPDVRIMNMSYIGGDWYIEQMRHAYNESAPVPLSLSMDTYRENDYIWVDDLADRPISLSAILDFVADPTKRVQISEEEWDDYIPARTLVIPVDKEKVLASGIVKPEDAHLIVDSIEFTLPGGSNILKPQLVLLDMLGTFDWSRPIYTTYPQLFREVGLGDWLQADGWAYRFVPIKTPYEILDTGRIDTERYYDLVMNRYKYGNAGDPKVFVDWHSVTNLRFVWHYNAFVRLAHALMEQGDDARAVEVLDRCQAEYPFPKFDYENIGGTVFSMIQIYYTAGADDKGDELLENYANSLQGYIEYYIRFDGRKAEMVADLCADKVNNLVDLSYIAAAYGRTEQYEAIDKYLDLFEFTDEPLQP